MNYLTFIAAAVFTLSLIEGIYVLSVNPRSSTNRLYFFMTLCLSLWLFGGGLAYTAHTRDAVVLFFRISSFGFVFLHAFTLHFSIRISIPKISEKLRALLPLIYLPSIYFMYRSLTGLIVYSDFIRPEKLWLAVPALGDPTLLLLMVHYLSYYLVSAFFLLHWQRNTGSRREKRQARLILISILSTIFFFNLEPFILPLLFGPRTLGLSPIFSIIWVSGIGYAVWKYRLLRWDPESIGKDILNTIDEAVIVLDPGYRPVYMNEPARRMLPETDQPGSGIHTLIRNNPSVTGDLERLLCGNIQDLSCRLSLPGKTQGFLDAKFSLVRDTFDDVQGITLIGRAVKDKIAFKALFVLSEKEMKVLRLVLEGLKTDDIAAELDISVRTVKYYLANIYTKLNVKNKIELFRVLKDYNLFPEQEAETVAFPLLLKKSKKDGGLAL